VEGIDGYQLMMNMQQQAERFGARIRSLATVESVELGARPFAVTVDGERIEAQTIIIATGAGHRHLGIESEHLLENKGVTYCATCDGALPMFRNKPLVVIGGGDSACEEALYLTRFGSVVHLIHRRDALRASKIMADRVLAHPKIKPVWNSEVVEILDVAKDEVTGVRVRDTVTGAETTMDCAGVFIAIGLVPNTGLFKGVIDMDESG
jgi:thioredoxin reductase (NADPH)